MVILDITIVYPLDKGVRRKGEHMVEIILSSVAIALNIAIIAMIIRRWKK